MNLQNLLRDLLRAEHLHMYMQTHICILQMPAVACKHGLFWHAMAVHANSLLAASITCSPTIDMSPFLKQSISDPILLCFPVSQ